MPKKPKRKITWSDTEVEVLLCTVIEENFKAAEGKKARITQIFKIAEQRLTANGFKRDVEQIKTKLKNLKKQYLMSEEVPNFALVDEVFSSCKTEFIEDEVQNSDGTELRRKVRKISWTDKEVEMLLRLIIEEKGLKNMSGVKYSSTDIYKTVHQKLMQHGFERDVDQIRTKVKGLKKKFLAGEEDLPNFELCQVVFGNEPVFIEVQGDNISEYDLLDEIICCTPVGDEDVGKRKENLEKTRKKLKRKIAWTDREIEVLLRTYIKEDNRRKAEGKSYHTIDVCRVVYEKMAELGFNRDAEQIQTKLKNLKKQYLKGEEISNYVLVDILFNSQKPQGIGESLRKKTRRMAWTDEEIEVLLHAFIEEQLQKKANGQKYRNRDIYKVVQRKLMEHGYKRDEELILAKLKYLKKQYLAGVEDLPHYELIDHIFNSCKLERIEQVDVAEDVREELQSANTIEIKVSSPTSSSNNRKKRKIGWNDTVREEEIKKKSIGDNSQQKLSDYGFDRDVEQINTKMKNLKKKYLAGDRIQNENVNKCEEICDQSQKKRRKLMQWCDKEVGILLCEIKEEILLKDARSITNGKINYETAQKKLSDCGFERDVEEIKAKVQILEQDYLTGVNTPYYELLDEIFNSEKLEISDDEIGNRIKNDSENEIITSKFDESSLTSTQAKKRGGSGFFDRENELIDKHQKWLANEFRKQRRFEKQQTELFRQDFQKLVDLIKRNFYGATTT